MKQINENRQTAIQNIIKENTDYITNVLEKLAADQWTDLNPAQNTVKRLKRKGLRGSAEQFMEYYDFVKRKNMSLDNVESEALVDKPKSSEEINKIVKEGISGSNDMESSNFLHKGSRVARSVARIIDKDNREPLGTGFLVSPNLFITNNHVIPDRRAALQNIIEFDFVANDTENIIESVEFKLLPDVFFVHSPEGKLDYSILAVEKESKNGISIDDYGWIKLIEEVDKAAIGERLNIIHHPMGKPQQTSFRKNLLITHDESLSRLFYMTDTEEGSSGSPVFNDQWELVALHFGSQEINNKHQKELFYKHMYNKYTELAPETKEDVVRVNVGMRISAIVNNINKESVKLTPEQIKLKDEMFNLKSSSIKRPSIYKENNHLQANNDYDFNSNVPMNININIGNRNFKDPYGDSNYNINRYSNGSIGELQTKLELYNKQVNSQKSVFNALMFLEKARGSKYLLHDSERKTIQDTYYNSIFSDIQNGISKKDLYNKLNSLLSSTIELVDRFPDSNIDLESLFKNEKLESLKLEGGVSYARARAHLYTWVDLYPDRMLRGVYTQLLIAPEQLLLKDLIQSLKLDVELPKRYNNNQFLNCEHIVPQSLFGKDPLGVSDLHHLITADGATNNFRSDCAYRDLGNLGEKGPKKLPEYINHGGKKHNDFFEPFNNKPLVARATLYFIVTHKNKLAKTIYDEDAIKTLIEWSNKSKPSDYEVHRNDSIFELQGNRNPFIDFPDWVNKVDFSIGLKS